MRIAVLSGKGGTGKTTVAASLAAVIPTCQYADCDVEEPNGFIFLQADLRNSEEVHVLVPEVDAAVCTGCGACGRICQFNAIAVVKGKVLLFPELCHHCGACVLVCQPAALTEVERSIGTVEYDEPFSFVHGRLNIGEPAGLAVIDSIKAKLQPSRPAVLDCAPGASCAVVKSLEDVDFALLVTEPTPFGLHDLAIAVELLRQLGLPAGVVINKAGSDNRLISDFCQEKGLPVLLEIPFSKAIAQKYAAGRLPVADDPYWQERFCQLYDQIQQILAGEEEL